MKYVYIEENLINKDAKIYFRKPNDDKKYIRKKIYGFQDENSKGEEPDHDELREHLKQLFKKNLPHETLDERKLKLQYEGFKSWHEANDWCRRQGKNKIPITNWKLRVTQWFTPKLNQLISYKMYNSNNKKSPYFNNLK